MASGAATSSQLLKHWNTVSPTTAERCVATARGVVFATVLILMQCELVASGAEYSAFGLLNILAILYVIATSIPPFCGRELTRLHLPLLAVDVLLITSLILTSGRPGSEYYLLYYLPILQAGVRLRLRDAVAAAVLSGTLYTFAALIEGDTTVIHMSAAARAGTFAGSALLMAITFGLINRGVRAQLEWHERVTQLGADLCTRADVLSPDQAGEANGGGAQDLGSAEGPIAASYRLAETAPRAILQLVSHALGAEHRLMRIEAHGDMGAYWVISEPQEASAPSDVFKSFARKAVELAEHHGQAFVLPTIGREPEFAEHAKHVRTALALPLKLGGRTVATIVLCGKHPTETSPRKAFLEADLHMACALAPQAALLLDYAHIHRETQSVLNRAVGTLAAAIDAKDPDTRGHSDRVAVYAVGLATAMGLPSRVVEAVELAALLHDVGKIGIPEGVLNGKTSLDEREWELVKEHPVMGSRIFENLDELSFIQPALRYHHERYDGSGYPDGLKGEDIPLLARMVAVGDAFDAMTYGRPYQDSMSVEAACEELSRWAGVQFDPHLVDVFVQAASPQLFEAAQQAQRSVINLTRKAYDTATS